MAASHEKTLPHDAAEVGAALSADELVAFPTETFYGLGARVTEAAVARVQAVKGRDAHKPIALVAATLADVEAFADLDASVRALAHAFWPGPLTVLVFPRGDVPQGVCGPDGSVGVRVSGHPVAREVARLAGGLVTATSANLAGEAPVTRSVDLNPALLARVQVVLAGECPGRAASTVVGVRDGAPYVVREGAVSRAQLARVLEQGPR